MNRALACSAGACALLVAASARGDPPREARLRYTRGQGAERCPEEAVLRSAVAARLGYDPFRADAPRTITASIARAGRALRADVKLIDASGRVTGARELMSNPNDCSELVGAVTLAISIAIDPESEMRSPTPPSPAPPPSSSPATRATSPSVPTPPPAPSSSSPAPPPPKTQSQKSQKSQKRPDEIPPRLRAYAGLAGFVAVGTEPSITLGLAVAVGLRRGATSISLEGRADLPASTEAPGGGSVSASLLLLTLSPCYHRDLFLACGLISAGVLRGQGSLVERPHDDATTFASAGVRLGIEPFRSGPFSARLYGDFAVTLTPTSLELKQRGVWSTPPVAGALGIAGLIHFL